MHHSLYATPSSALSTRIELPSGRRLLARILRTAALSMARFSRHLAHPAGPPGAGTRRTVGDLPRFEYCADAGAPEGALYIDGEYVGRLEMDRL